MSYKHAIVPLDGSTLAECVFSHIEALAAGGQIEEVELVRVVPPIEMHYKAVVPIDAREEQQLNQAAVKDAEQYLQKIKAKLAASGLKISTKVLTGSVAETLGDYMKKSGADILILATHGRSGPSRWAWGSVTDKILRISSLPVFLVRPASCNLGI